MKTFTEQKREKILILQTYFALNIQRRKGIYYIARSFTNQISRIIISYVNKILNKKNRIASCEYFNKDKSKNN